MWAFRIMQKDILGLHYSELQWSDSLFQVFFLPHVSDYFMQSLAAAVSND